MSRELEAVTTSKRELEGKAEAYLRKIRDSRAEQVAVEEQLRKELSSQVYNMYMCVSPKGGGGGRECCPPFIPLMLFLNALIRAYQ